MPNPNDLLIFFRDRVGAVTAISAIVAAGGALIAYLGLTSVRRVMLSDEYKRITGIREPSLTERLQQRLNQSGIRLKLGEFIAVGLLVGAVAGAILIGLGFVTIGLCAVPAGITAYYQVLMARRAREYVAFAEQLPDAIDDAVEYFAVHNNVTETVRALANDGPPALRPEFQAALSLIQRSGYVTPSLVASGQQRPEAFWRQFMDALAAYETQGGNLREILERIARAQRAQSRLHRRIAAQQAGGRMVGLIYGASPFAFLIFIRFTGGVDYVSFYASALGQGVQVLVLLTGLVTWWLTGKVARRGIYLTDRGDAPTLDADVHRTGFQKTVIQP